MTKTRIYEEKKAPRESPRSRVLNWLTRSIASGEYPQGAELPPEREIAKLVGVAPNTAAAAMDEAEVRGLAVRRRPGARKRYAGIVRGPGATHKSSFASSMVCVLATLRQYTDLATAPGWSDEFLALDVVRRLSLAGRPAALVDLKSPPAGGLDSIFAARPGAMVVTDGVNADPLAMRALARCREAGIPAVAYGNAPELRGYDRAYSDHRAGSRDVTRRLLAHGCRRIVPFFPFVPTHFWEHERLEGYAEAMREAGLEPHPVVVIGSPAIDIAQKEEAFRLQTALAVTALVALRRDDGGGPDALLCLNDDWAKPSLAAIRDLGLVPNRDILVAGYDNKASAPTFAPDLRPAITVDKHNELMATDIAELVVARMDGTLPPEPQARIHKHEIVVLSPELATPHR